jgi:hypothetical protein
LSGNTRLQARRIGEKVMANRIFSGISATISILLFAMALGLLIYGILVIYRVVP